MRGRKRLMPAWKVVKARNICETKPLIDIGKGVLSRIDCSFFQRLVNLTTWDQSNRRAKALQHPAAQPSKPNL